MTSYLSQFREEVPLWIHNYLRGEQISFRDIMSSRVAYYPGFIQRCNCDGTLMKVGNKSHSVHSFLYVDYLITRERLQEQLALKDSILGYHPIGQIDWKESDLSSACRFQILKPLRNIDETPYCFSVIMERNEEKDDSWGAEHFIVTFLFGEGISTFYKLFVKEYAKAPWLFLLNERYRKGLFEQDIQRSRYYPKFVIFAKKAYKWQGYEKVEDVSPVFGEFRARRDLYVHHSVSFATNEP